MEYFTLEPKPTPAKEEQLLEESEPEVMPVLPFLSNNNALCLFDQETHEGPKVQEEEMRACFVDQKRKVVSPGESVISSKKSWLSKEWQLNENENGQKFFVNIRTGQVVRDVPKKEEEFTIVERRKFMPFGTSPILKLAPRGELILDLGNQQKLIDEVEKRLTGLKEMNAIYKWNSFEEMEVEKDKLGQVLML